VFTLAKGFDDEGEVEESEEEDIEFLEAREGSGKPLSRRKSRSISLRHMSGVITSGSKP
jgi:hypothetical protein